MWARKIFTGEPWKKEYFKIVDYIKDFYFNFCERKDRNNGLNINVTCWKYLKCYATQMARWDAKIPIFSVTSLVSGHKCARNLPKIKLVYLELGRSSLICSDFRWPRTSLLVLNKIYTFFYEQIANQGVARWPILYLKNWKIHIPISHLWKLFA